MDCEGLTLEFDGHTFAKGWCSVALAASTDEERPALYRAVSIEVYDHGVQLVATDGYMLLRSWVPCDAEVASAPTIDEKPLTCMVAQDLNGRAANLLTWVLKETSKKDALPMAVVVDLGPASEPDGQAFDGMARQRVTVEVPGSERVELRVYEAEWVTWRALVAQFVGEQTGVVALNPDLLDRLVKLGKIHGKPLVWTFGGHDRLALVEIRDSDPWVTGCAMPMRLTKDELEFAEYQGSTPGDGDLLSEIMDHTVDLVNAGALDTEDMKVAASRG